MNFSNEKIVGKIIEINNDDILPNRFQPRKYFDEEETLELAESIKEHGILQPVVVRQVGDKYEVIAGERRYKANILAGNDSIPAIVSNLNDKESSEIAVIENIQRQDLTPIEEAISYKRIIDMGYITQEELARKIGKSQSAVANKIRLLKLSDEVQDALMEKKISERHARSLLQLDSLNKQNELLKKIIEERLTVRKTDEEIRKMNNNELNNQNMTNMSIDNGVAQATPVANIYNQETPASVPETPNMDVSPIMGTPVNNFAETMSVPVVEDTPVQTEDTALNNPSVNLGVENVASVDTNNIEVPAQPVDIPIEQSVQSPINNDVPVANSIPVEQPTIDNNTPLEAPSVVLPETPASVPEMPANTPIIEEVPSTPIQPVETPIVQDTPTVETSIPEQPITNEPASDISIFNPVVETPIVQNTPVEEQNVSIEDTSVPEMPANTPITEEVPSTPIQPVETPIVQDTLAEDTPVPSFIPEQPVENQTSTPVVDLNQNTITEEQTEDVPLNNNIETPVDQTPDPIIVTNNETQYDPIMPDQQPDEPTLDFKTIINLIRQCSSTIEKCGYKIDTEEYDLEGKYQVTFIIEK